MFAATLLENFKVKLNNNELSIKTKQEPNEKICTYFI